MAATEAKAPASGEPAASAQRERAVFTRGRSFAVSAGVEEIKRGPDSNSSCSTDAAQGLTVCTPVRPVSNGSPCVFTAVSAPAVDPGTLFERRDLAATSFFQGGPYRFDLR